MPRFVSGVVAVGAVAAACLIPADFNRDGAPDLAVANINSNSVSVLLNTSPPPTVPVTAGGSEPTPVTPTAPPPVVPASPGEPLHAVVALAGSPRLERGRRPRLVTGFVVTCPAPLRRSCGGSSRVTASVPGGQAARVVTIAKLGFALRPGESRRIILRLTPRGARILRVRVTIRLTTRGAKGVRVVSKRSAVVRV